MLPPKSVCSAAPKEPTILRERTTMPRTSPQLATTRWPGSSNVVVILSSKMPMGPLPSPALPKDILPAYVCTHTRDHIDSHQPADRVRRRGSDARGACADEVPGHGARPGRGHRTGVCPDDGRPQPEGLPGLSVQRGYLLHGQHRRARAGADRGGV